METISEAVILPFPLISPVPSGTLSTVGTYTGDVVVSVTGAVVSGTVVSVITVVVVTGVVVSVSVVVVTGVVVSVNIVVVVAEVLVVSAGAAVYVHMFLPLILYILL